MVASLDCSVNCIQSDRGNKKSSLGSLKGSELHRSSFLLLEFCTRFDCAFRRGSVFEVRIEVICGFFNHCRFIIRVAWRWWKYFDGGFAALGQTRGKHASLGQATERRIRCFMFVRPFNLQRLVKFCDCQFLRRLLMSHY